MTVGLISVGGTNWSLVDGSPLAPTGTPQYPNYFTGLFGTTYVARPPWKVAGVDYAVGPRPSVTLQPWTTICPSGGSSGVFTDDGDNITATGGSNLSISGIDFTNPSNRQLFLNGATGSNLISDCKFVSTITHVSPCRLTCSNPTVQYCTFIGAGNVNAAGSSGDLKFDSATGACIAKYCYFQNACEQNLAHESSASLLSQFNFFDEAGLGTTQAFAPHGDWIFTESDTSINPIGSITVSFCVGKQTTATATATTQGFAAEFNGGGTQANIPIYANGVTFNNNSCVCASGASVNYFFVFSTTQTPSPPPITVSQNYVDLRFLGTSPTWYSNNVNTPLAGDQHGTTSISGNIRMDTGASIT